MFFERLLEHMNNKQSYWLILFQRILIKVWSWNWYRVATKSIETLIDQIKWAFLKVYIEMSPVGNENRRFIPILLWRHIITENIGERIDKQHWLTYAYMTIWSLEQSNYRWIRKRRTELRIVEFYFNMQDKAPSSQPILIWSASECAITSTKWNTLRASGVSSYS